MGFIMLLLLIIPSVLAQTDILIKVEIQRDLTDLEAEGSGENNRKVSDDELRTLGINKRLLRNAVWKLNKVAPDKMFFVNPNASCNVYTSKGWAEVTRKIEPERRHILKIQKKPVVIASKEITNNKSRKVTVDADLTHDTHHTMLSSWGNFSVTNNNHKTMINYKVQIDDSDFLINFSSPFGKNTQETLPISVKRSVGRDPSFFIKLGPMERARVELMATQIVIRLQFEYEIEFEGDVVCYFAKGPKGKKYKKYDIEKLLEVGNLPKEVVVKQLLEYTLYTDIKAKVKRQNSIDGR